MKLKINIFIMLILCVLVYAQDNNQENHSSEGTPIEIILTLDDCLQRAKTHSLQEINAKLDMDQVDIDHNDNWVEELIPDISYVANYEADITAYTSLTGSGSEYDSPTGQTITDTAIAKHGEFNNQEVRLTVPVFSDDFITAVENVGNNKLRKEMILTNAENYMFYQIRYYFCQIILRQKYIEYLNEEISNFEELKNSSSGMSSSLAEWYRLRIDEYITNTKQIIFSYQTSIKKCRQSLLNILNYPDDRNISFSGSLPEIEVDFENDLANAIESSYRIKQYTLDKYQAQKNIERYSLGMFPQIKAKVQTELAEGLYVGADAVLNTYDPDYFYINYADYGNYEINLFTYYEIPDSTTDFIDSTELPGPGDPDFDILSNITFDFRIEYSLNEILFSNERKKSFEITDRKTENLIQMEINRIIQDMNGYLADIEAYSRTLELDNELFETNRKKAALFPAQIKLDGLYEVNSYTSLLWNSVSYINSEYVSTMDRLTRYLQYLRSIEGRP